jgi:hypothetical protein
VLIKHAKWRFVPASASAFSPGPRQSNNVRSPISKNPNPPSDTTAGSRFAILSTSTRRSFLFPPSLQLSVHSFHLPFSSTSFLQRAPGSPVQSLLGPLRVSFQRFTTHHFKCARSLSSVLLHQSRDTHTRHPQSFLCNRPERAQTHQKPLSKLQTREIDPFSHSSR